MPGYLIIVIVLAAILCVLLVWLAVLRVQAERRATARRQMSEIREDAKATVARLDASYRRALRDVRRPRS